MLFEPRCAIGEIPRLSPRVQARPIVPTDHAQAGLQSLGPGKGGGWLSVPETYRNETKAPLILMLHGARGSSGLEAFCEHAARRGIVVAVPASTGQTWDAIESRGRFGSDVQVLDRALRLVFRSVAVDPKHIAIAGFSDGASYALSIGLANGDLFTHIIAYSAGGLVPSTLVRRPSLFITHGIGDLILPITSSSRVIVPTLRKAGYRVEYEEFDGGHTMPRHLVEKSFDWFLRR
jgi:phospholipase/carboxylesterase